MNFDRCAAMYSIRCRCCLMAAPHSLPMKVKDPGKDRVTRAKILNSQELPRNASSSEMQSCLSTLSIALSLSTRCQTPNSTCASEPLEASTECTRGFTKRPNALLSL